MDSKKTSTKPFSLLALFTLSGLIVVVDQVTKYVSNSNLTEHMPVAVIPGFDLLLAYNRGAAFSFLNDAGGWQRWLLTGISIAVSGFLLAWLIKLPKTQRLLGFALALILGGAVGNLIDRMLAGYVIDFISLYFMDYRFATFNIADAAISIGAALMILDIVIDFRRSNAANTAT